MPYTQLTNIADGKIISIYMNNTEYIFDNKYGTHFIHKSGVFDSNASRRLLKLDKIKTIKTKNIENV